ncbi:MULTISPECIES: ParA family protein [Marinobacter]|jgi:cellulose biosynthesis protein BcsQ|uniref:ParA-like protein n=5 Tax=Marinobacter TaxID=2742 RepID=A0A833JTZ9_MARNT|nr:MULTISPECIES: ParA family protein [Marinobacter]MEC7432394.1 ParA family protein [Pseudomonadota bacterium]KAE8546030.1 ParA-like protein [Marinobacter nauticus]MAC24184.1 chromosome partitioning protein [Marinobacter sp.]MCS5560795.1 ParA family protein [Marinobacter nauticus]MEC8897114.1 ParA family protein [Pseudomonadota bacterium]|tara:strand:+ start:51 stop:818 length:768 start_codon:yes stop_codon:yes gene_type:complete
MRIIAFYSPKGGVGKTAAAVNTAYLASRDNLRTLLWDLDPQGASSFYLAGAEPVKGRKLSKLLEGKSPIARFIHEDVYPNLDFIPAHSSFRNFDIKLEQEHDGNALKDLLAPLSEDTSLVILDCPPTLSRLTEQVLDVADKVYVPVVPTWLSLNSWDQLKDFVKDKKLGVKKLRPFFSMVDRRKNLHRDVLARGTELLTNPMPVAVPYASVVERMGEEGQPLERLAPRSPAAEEYRKIWQAIQADLGLSRKRMFR